MTRSYYIYILSSPAGCLYTGVTNDIRRRILQHRERRDGTFTGKYNVTQLVYLETTEDVHGAIAREKQIKAWRREKRVRLVDEQNPSWADLARDWDVPSPPTLGAAMSATRADEQAPSSLRSSG